MVSINLDVNLGVMKQKLQNYKQTLRHTSASLCIALSLLGLLFHDQWTDEYKEVIFNAYLVYMVMTVTRNAKEIYNDHNCGGGVTGRQ